MGVNVTLTIDEVLLARLDALAKRTERSRDHVAEDAIARLLDVEAERIAAPVDAADRNAGSAATSSTARDRASLSQAELAALSSLFSEWASPEDARAYDEL